MPPYRLACPLNRGEPTKSHLCEDGVMRMTKMRKHLEEYHKCNCPDPYTCTQPQHMPADLIDHLVVLSLDKAIPTTDRWVRMYKTAFPTHRRVPGPCVPRLHQILKLAKHPKPKFKKSMIDRLVRDEQLSEKKATKELQSFLNRVPLFYDVLSQPEVWNQELPTPSATDESGGDESDDELEISNTQTVEVATPDTTDYCIQQGDGNADEEPDTQTEQEAGPSAPSSS